MSKKEFGTEEMNELAKLITNNLPEGQGFIILTSPDGKTTIRDTKKMETALRCALSWTDPDMAYNDTKAYLVMHGFDPRKENARSWLYRLINECLEGTDEGVSIYDDSLNRVKAALKKLVILHIDEQEGLNKPTPSDWFSAVSDAQLVLSQLD